MVGLLLGGLQISVGFCQDLKHLRFSVISLAKILSGENARSRRGCLIDARSQSAVLHVVLSKSDEMLEPGRL
jgi:hypothetical protein